MGVACDGPPHASVVAGSITLQDLDRNGRCDVTRRRQEKAGEPQRRASRRCAITSFLANLVAKGLFQETATDRSGARG